MILKIDELASFLEDSAIAWGVGCKRVFVAISGGIDSSTVAAILCRAFGPERVVGMYRDIKSDPKHFEDARELQRTLGFRLVFIDGNSMYREFLRQAKEQFEALGLPWVDEGADDADASGFTSAYGSLKSRFTTPMAGFIAKAIDQGGGRIFGTGNGEEDGLLRYFDKFGDGAVDNNILAGLTKAEVRQLARYYGIPERLITKKPSADLEAKGDAHNDEDQLTSWAKALGFDIRISYGSPDGSVEGNVAWAWKEELRKGVISGSLGRDELAKAYGDDEKAQVILFLREVERRTRHKALGIPCIRRQELFGMGLVD